MTSTENSQSTLVYSVADAARSGRCASTPWRPWLQQLVRFGVSAILLFAASMKLYSLSRPVELLGGDRLFGGPIVLGAMATVELALGLWLAVDGTSVLCCKAATVVFAIFFIATLARAFSGEPDCGCFGPLRVSPWWTAALDAFVLASLVFAGRANEKVRGAISLAQLRCSACWFAACLLVAAVAVTVLRLSIGTTRTVRAGIEEYDGLTVVDPDAWTKGDALPLLEDVEIDALLEKDNWTLLFVHHDCSACRELLDRLSTSEVQAMGHLAVVQVPPVGDVPTVAGSVEGRLSADRYWFVPTPLRIDLSDGKVIRIESEYHESEYQ